MKIAKLYFPFIFTLLALACSPPADKKVQELKCEYLTNPRGIEKSQPRLSWILNLNRRGSCQTAYQIQAASEAEYLSGEKIDLWDSGRIFSDQSVHILYQGKKLISRQSVYWRVRIWDEHGQPSPWSDPASWEMALLTPEDWQAVWVGRIDETDSSDSSPLFRKSFRIEKPVRRARVYISGLGYYELYLNGKKVGDHVLSPNQTNYDRRRDENWQEARVGHMSTRVLYEIFDIGDFLQKGQNVIGVWLGGGWYIQNDRVNETFLLYDTPRFISQVEIEYTDGDRQLVLSDETWKASPSPIIHNGLHSGEIYDANLEIESWQTADFNDRSWDRVRSVRPPTGILHAQISPPDRVVETIKSVQVKMLGENTYRFDLGRMISGWTRLSVRGPAGTRLHLKFIEELGPSYGQTDTYILKGAGEEVWEPRFSWHAFRLVDITSEQMELKPENLSGRVVNTDVTSAGSFQCSNQLFNQIYQNYRHTQLGNMHGGVTSDCPHRERRGYTGDGQVASPAALYSFDMAAFYTKWINDIADAQNKVSGYVPNTAPYQDGGGGTAWGSAFVVIPWNMYLFYGDVQILQSHYPGMKNWLDYLHGQLDKRGLLVNQGLGEWVPPDINQLDPDFVNSCYYYYNCILMSKIASVLGHEKDIENYLKWARYAKTAINSHFFHAEKNNYATGRQGASVFPLGFGIASEKFSSPVLKNLLIHTSKTCQGHFDTGILATPLLLDVLTANNHVELAYTLMNQHDYPSFGYMIEKGATTIWETWQGDQSHSHPMFGSVCKWFFQALAGINPDESQPGFKNVIIKPFPVEGLDFVKCSYRSAYGVIQSNWEIKENDFYLHLTIPANSHATVYLPALSAQHVTESGHAITGKDSAVSFSTFADQRAVYQLKAGDYRFKSRGIAALSPVPVLSAPLILPGDTLAFKPDSVQIRIFSQEKDAQIRYTCDGKQPNGESPLYRQPFFVHENTTICARVIKQGREPGYTRTQKIQFVDPLLNGLTWYYFEGQWEKLPDFDQLKMRKSGHIFQFGVDKIITEKDEFGLVIEGKIQIAETGWYTFYTMSNDGSCLYLDNQLVVNNDGAHGPQEKSGGIFLQKGFHPIRLTYFQAGGGLALQVKISGPGLDKQEITPDLLFL